ncbi:MAG: hypothetical protein K2Y21_02775 [Phycisphaerales bacterium]|nr:hypothetical protein [Phycisphaerales bacterium]
MNAAQKNIMGGAADEPSIDNGFEPDDNGNAVPDLADIASGFSNELNREGRPNERAASCSGYLSLDWSVEDPGFVGFAL